MHKHIRLHYTQMASYTHTHRLQADVLLHTHTAAYRQISRCIHTQTHICVQTDGQLYKCSSWLQADGQLHTSNWQQREGQLHIYSWLQVNDCTTCTMYSCLQTAVYIKMVSCTQTADNIQMASCSQTTDNRQMASCSQTADNRQMASCTQTADYTGRNSRRQKHIFCISKNLLSLGEDKSIRQIVSRPIFWDIVLYFFCVVDRHRFDAYPDPTFHFITDPDPDTDITEPTLILLMSKNHNFFLLLLWS